MEASALHATARFTRLTYASPLLKLRSDEQLVALLRQGSEEAFRVIHDRFRQRLFAYVRQMLGPTSRQDADDVLQDVFARAYTALRADRRDVHLRPWLYRVAHNRCIDYLRQASPPTSELFESAGKPLHDPFEDVQRREDLQRLVADIGRLPDQQRSALLMREMDGMSYRELAEALEVTVPAVKSLLVRARVELVETAQARAADCVVIQDELLDSYDSRLKVSPTARRHIRDCGACQEYRGALGGMRKSFAALSPIAAVGPLAVLGKLLGIGGSGGGASAGGGGAAAGGSSLAAGLGSATAGKLAVVASTAAITAGGAIEIERRVTDGPPSGGFAVATGSRAPVADPMSPVTPLGWPSAGAGGQTTATSGGVTARGGAAGPHPSTPEPSSLSASGPFGEATRTFGGTLVPIGQTPIGGLPSPLADPSIGSGPGTGSGGGSSPGAGGGPLGGVAPDPVIGSDPGSSDGNGTIPGRFAPVIQPDRGQRPNLPKRPIASPDARADTPPSADPRPSRPQPDRPFAPGSSIDTGVESVDRLRDGRDRSPKPPKVDDSGEIRIPKPPKAFDPSEVAVPELPKFDAPSRIRIPKPPKVVDPVDAELPDPPVVELPALLPG